MFVPYCVRAGFKNDYKTDSLDTPEKKSRSKSRSKSPFGRLFGGKSKSDAKRSSDTVEPTYPEYKETGGSSSKLKA